MLKPLRHNLFGWFAERVKAFICRAAIFWIGRASPPEDSRKPILVPKNFVGGLVELCLSVQVESGTEAGSRVDVGSMFGAEANFGENNLLVKPIEVGIRGNTIRTFGLDCEGLKRLGPTPVSNLEGWDFDFLQPERNKHLWRCSLRRPTT